jgi:hypothetical protein
MSPRRKKKHRKKLKRRRSTQRCRTDHQQVSLISVPEMQHMDSETYLRVTPPMYVPRNVAVFTTFADGSVAKVGNSWIYVATHVRTAASPTRLQTENTRSYPSH